MKKILIIFLSILIFTNISFGKKKIPPTISVLQQQLMAFDYKAYLGKPIDSMLVHLPTGIVRTYVTFWHVADSGDEFYIEYPENLSVQIFVKEFHFANPDAPSSNWSTSLMRKEKIYYSILYKSGECLKGCENEPQY